MCDSIVQWATILSPVIAVILAWWTGRSSARNTAKLVQSIKKLMLIYIKTELLYLDKEAKEEHAQFEILLKRSRSLSEQSIFYDKDWSSETLKQHREKERDVEDKKDYTFDRREVIVEKMSELIKLMQDVKKI